MNRIWRYIVSGMLGAFVGFTGQFAADMTRYFDFSNLSWKSAALVSVPSEIPRLFSDGPPYYWAYLPDKRVMGTPYWRDGKPFFPDGAAGLTIPLENQKSQWRNLFYQLLLLQWLQLDGPKAGQVAAFGALVAMLSAYGVNRIRQKTS